MFDLNKDRSRDRERLERLWRLEDSKSQSLMDNWNRSTQEGMGFWSAVGTLIVSFLLALLTAFLCIVLTIKPEMVPYHSASSSPESVVAEVDSGPPSTSLASVNPSVIAATRSTITGIVDSRSMTAAQYWTMILRADYGSKNEGEFDLVVPAGSAVSRVTLWVNGVAQEAAFNSTERVTAAYNEVVRRARDPLLVTWKAPNTYHVKVFPVTSASDFKFRIGLTTPLGLDRDGQLQVTVPHITNSNMRVDAAQDIHLESDVPLSAGRHDIRSEARDGGFLVRGNIPYEHMEQISMHGVRGDSTVNFVTRATHSSPPAFIVASLDRSKDGQSLSLRKSLVRPESVRLIASEHVACRLSTLWAIKEINNLVNQGIRSQAVDLAMTYRVVSPVSGATVLERQSDYDRFGLHRQMYRTTSYMQPTGRLAEDRDGGPAVQAESSAALSDSFSSTAMLQGATNGTIGPQGDDASAIMGVNTAGTLRVNSLVMAESYGAFAGPVGNWIAASARDANLYGAEPIIVTASARDANMMFGVPVLSRSFFVTWLPLIFLSAFSFLGATTLAVLAIRRRNEGSVRTTLLFLSALWMILAIVSPGGSQLLLAIVAAGFLYKKIRR